MSIRICLRTVFAVLCATLSFSLLVAQAPPDGPTGTSRQELVGGTIVTPAIQLQYNLLTLNNPAGSCSASMLNSSWAITAAHCVYPSTTAVTLPFAASQIKLTENWSTPPRSANGLKLIAYDKYPFDNNDIALIQVNQGVFFDAGQPDRILNALTPVVGSPSLAFGRGINSLAFFTPANVPKATTLDGQYRSAQFDLSSVGLDASNQVQSFSYPGKNGAIIAGGDSGGPSFLQAWDHPDSLTRQHVWELAGVHSKCATTCLAGQSCTPPANPWQWVSAVTSCTDAAILPIRATILSVIQETAPVAGPTGSFDTGVNASVLAHPRALYAMNIDEPLLASAGGAIDVQLHFKMCHGIARIGVAGCPLTPEFQVWSYDLATHRIVSTQFSKCLNISGARRDASAWVILFPCTADSNEKWTVISPSTSSFLTFRSDLSGLCLTAQPGNPGGGTRLTATLATPGTLIQAACNGSASQKFDSADADWARRNGPH